jgi:imidazolonepropionase-like amidohydrolase
VRVGVGTDTIGDIVDEMTFLTECGMTRAQAISAATHTNAQILGWDDRIGGIKPGMIADLFVVRGNPLSDLQVLRSVEWVMRGGIPVRPKDVRVPTQDETAEWTSLTLVD